MQVLQIIKITRLTESSSQFTEGTYIKELQLEASLYYSLSFSYHFMKLPRHFLSISKGAPPGA